MLFWNAADIAVMLDGTNSQTSLVGQGNFFVDATVVRNTTLDKPLATRQYCSYNPPKQAIWSQLTFMELRRASGV